MLLNHFKQLFRACDARNNANWEGRTQEDRTQDYVGRVENRLTEDLAILDSPFSEEDIFRALSSMANWKAPGYDDITVDFLKWH